MAFTAKDVAELRKQTGCGMMDCKRALTDSNGNLEEAIKILREKGMAATAKKASRIAAEGLVDILKDGNVTAMIEVNSETDFVAKNDTFKAFVQGILKTIIATRPVDVADLLTKKFADSDETVEAELQSKTFTIGEKLSIRRFVVFEGVTSTYIHGTGATGIVVSFDADDAAASNPGFAEFAKNIALQLAAFPITYVAKEDVPAAVIEEEKAILIKQMEQDPKFANKPAKVLEGIVTGKLGKYYEQNCLLEQAYVKDDSMKVSKYVADSAKAFGGSITVKSFARYDKGEGLEKREENFAEEIAKMVNKQ